MAVALGQSFRLPGTGTAGSIITGLFPSFDLCFVGLIAAIAAAQAFRMPASWAALCLGFVAFTAADVAYDRLLAAHQYTVGGLLDPTWSVALALMAL